MEIARFHVARELSFLRDKGFHVVAGAQVISLLCNAVFICAWDQAIAWRN